MMIMRRRKIRAATGFAAGRATGIRGFRRFAQVQSAGMSVICGFLVVLGVTSELRSQTLDASCTVTINGQTVQVNPDGSFGISNIAAPDLFGAGGPGTAPVRIAVIQVQSITAVGMPVSEIGRASCRERV